ncbi:TPA: hypothetical protein PW612_002692, partial [Mannheimia haemolytica]|nr:hypothetical protein [Mannheimia haemolytica]
MFQAEPKNGKVTVEVLKQYLIDELKIDEEEIAIVIGNQHELDNIDLFNPQCKINYIITVEALKEGWDCPFAYIFCSVQNVSSSKEAEQLLGRVLRMPYAKHRQIEDLNRAYAPLSSKSFGETARNLQDKLIGMGFEALEVAEMLRIPQQENWIGNEGDLFYTPTTVLALTQLPEMSDLSEAKRSQLKITEQEGHILVQVKGNLSEKLEKALIRTATGKKKEQIEQQLQIHQNRVEILSSPAEKGEIFKVIPQLCMNIQGEFDLADSQVLLDYQSWNLLDYPAKLDGFRLQENSQSFEIDVEDKRVSYHFNQQQLSFSDDWLRNPVKRGFSLPLAHQNFYPDFIVELIDGRILIVEYKGEQLKSNEDSKEKALIGNLWEKLSQGKGLFIMAVKSDENGQDVRTQLL